MDSTYLKTYFVIRQNFQKREKIKIVTVLAIFSMLVVSLIKINSSLNGGVSILNSALTLLLLLAIYLLAKGNKINLSVWSLIIIATAKIILLYLAIGANLPAALLTTLAICVLSGTFLSTKKSIFFSSLFSLSIIVLSSLENKKLLNFAHTLHSQGDGRLDYISYILISGIIIFLVWRMGEGNQKVLKKFKTNQTNLEEEKKVLELEIKRRINEIVNIKRDKMEQLQALANIGHLSSGIFHDIINPLTVVNLNLEQMKDDFKIFLPGAQDYIQQAMRASKQIQELIESANSYLRKQDPDKPFSIHHEIMEVIKMMGAKSRKNNVIFQVNAKENIYIRGGPTRFRRVIMNLIGNAIEASNSIQQENLIQINISRHNNLEFIIIEVIDQGIGITGENLKKIFSTFFSTKKNEGHNTGIGLSVVKSIVEEDFLGKIHVKSKVGEGTSFKIKIPCSYECYQIKT